MGITNKPENSTDVWKMDVASKLGSAFVLSCRVSTPWLSLSKSREHLLPGDSKVTAVLRGALSFQKHQPRAEAVADYFMPLVSQCRTEAVRPWSRCQSSFSKRNRAELCSESRTLSYTGCVTHSLQRILKNLSELLWTSFYIPPARNLLLSEALQISTCSEQIYFPLLSLQHVIFRCIRSAGPPALTPGWQILRQSIQAQLLAADLHWTELHLLHPHPPAGLPTATSVPSTSVLTWAVKFDEKAIQHPTGGRKRAPCPWRGLFASHCLSYKGMVTTRYASRVLKAARLRFFLFSANKSGHDSAGSTLLLEMTSRRKYKVTGFTSCDG